MFETNVPLKQISHYKIGGNAKFFFEAKDIDELINAVLKARKIKTPIFILAGGTNVLIPDEGFEGLIIKINNSGFGIQTDDSKFKIIKADAGTPMAKLVDYAAVKNLSGLEWAAGLPGTLGGAIRGNAGAFGEETKNIIDKVVSLDISLKNPKIVKRKMKNCDFTYRSSVFKKIKGKEIILEAILKLKEGNKQIIEEKTKQNINYRFSKHPMEYPSLGSTFKNIPLSQFRKNRCLSGIPVKNDPFPLIPAAFLISEAGLKGISSGGAMISPKHPNFIVNVLDATANDVKNLIQLAKNEVRKKFKIELQEEIERL